MKKHVTKDRRVIPLCEMEDSHLKNTIGYFAQRLSYARMVLDDQRSRFDAVVYSDEDEKEGAEDFVERYDELIGPYVLEAMIRDINVTDSIDLIRTTLQRASKRTPMLADFYTTTEEYNG